jgi:RNA polymerase sigma-70 factor (ECF subfamily)
MKRSFPTPPVVQPANRFGTGPALEIVSHHDGLPSEAVGAENFRAGLRTVGPRPVPTLRQIIEEHGAQAWRTLRLCGVPSADLPDVCQEVFLIVHRKIAEFEGRSSLRTWVYGICVKVAADHRRRARFRHERIVAEPPELPVFATQSDEIDDARTVERLFAILDSLDQAKREVFVLYEIEQRSMSEIAEALGCPLRTAYSRLEAARDQIMRAWRRDEIRWRNP